MSIEQIDVDKVLAVLKHAAATATNEEELRIKVSGVLESEVISKLGITAGRYEYTFVSGGRADALYGHVVIEYKAPGKLSKKPDIARAKEQLIGYIKKEAEVEDRFKLFLGVMLADKIAFVRYDTKTKNWRTRGPYDLNRQTALRLIEAIRGLRRKKLAVEELLGDFGPRSQMVRKAVKVLFNKIDASNRPKVKALFDDWKRLFSQVCAYSPEKLKGLETDYGISGASDHTALLFAIHTYYALLMKLLAAEVAYLFGAGKWLKSYVAEVEDAHMKGLDILKRTLEDLESGGVFKNLLNIANFMEGDYFSWYLEELDKEVAEVVSDIAKGLADYEPATPILEPEYTRDLLKRLYQNLVPKKIRHDLGEYYTPDWLAELLLNEAGLTLENLENLASEKSNSIAPLNLRVLDPACGSGTFLILALKRFKEYAEEHFLKDILADYILKNVIGFDLNPLAVLAARTNYLLTIADLLANVKGPIEIPIYLADSLLVETRTTLTGISYVIKTSVGVFELPKSVVEKGILGNLLEAVDKYVRLRYKPYEFKRVMKEDTDLSENELRLVDDLYKTFLKLEVEGKNHVWTSIIRNAFAPLTLIGSLGKFDYVVGNPPWIAWENLPSEYRESVRTVFRQYRVMPKKLQAKVKMDLSMLFSHVGLHRYLKSNGTFGFLITQTVFVSIAGAGFRRFMLPDGTPVKVIKIHDLVDLLPFEGAQNRTAMFIAKKGEHTAFPIPYTKWRSAVRGVDPSLLLDEVMMISRKIELYAEPLLRDTSSPWIALEKGVLKKIKAAIGKAAYKAHEGVGLTPRGAFIIEALEKSDDCVVVTNAEWPRAKIKIEKEITRKIEKSVIYRILFGRDLQRWGIEQERRFYSIILYKPRSGRIYNEGVVKGKYPNAYGFLHNFKNVFIKAANYKQFGKGAPFYFIYRMGKRAFAPFKVMWKEVSTQLDAVVVSGLNDPFLGDTLPIPDYTCVYVPLQHPDEAHYLCAVLNSTISRCVTSYIHLHPDPHVLDFIKIPPFDKTKSLHIELAKLSKAAHELAKKENAVETSKVESMIDKLVAQLYSMTDEELKAVQKTLAILKGEKIEEEIIEEEATDIRVTFLNAVVKPGLVGSFEVAIVNPLKEELTIELRLQDHQIELRTWKEKDTLRVKVPSLDAGEYKVPYKVIAPSKVTEGEFTLYVKEGKRFRTGEDLASKLDELLGD